MHDTQSSDRAPAGSRPRLRAGDRAAPHPVKEASIDFANNGGIRDWREDGDRTIYVQDRFRRWYRATLMRPSYDLRGALAIRFDTGPGDTFDHFSSVVIRGQRYAVESLVRIDGPPPSRASRAHKHR